MEMKEQGDELVQLFTRHAANRPSAVAVHDGDKLLTYGDMDVASDRVARRLMVAGIRPGMLVALALPRGALACIAILGVLKSGAAYLPLDPDDDSERAHFQLANSGASHVVVADQRAPDGLAPQPVTRTTPTGSLPPGTAYVIYTSGSTGTPKGVPVPTVGVVDLLRSAHDVFALNDHDVWSQVHSLVFDVHVWELWGALSTGARLVIVPPATVRNPYQLARFTGEHRVTVLSQVPTSFAALVTALRRVPAALDALRYVVLAGEPVRMSSLEQWRAGRMSPAARIINMYGITETAVHVTAADVTDFAERPPHPGATPVGLPLAHLRLIAVDPNTLRPVPPGDIGELMVAGSSVAPGYLDRPELTAQRFVRLPDTGAPNTWYRSGDLALWSHGMWWHVGRSDDQVQIKGVRIELGEIETVLRGCPFVDDAVVCAPSYPDSGHRLVAAYVPAAEVAPPVDVQAVRGYLAARLPPHMIPSAFLAMDELPVTAGGKLNRRAVERRWIGDREANTCHEHV